MKLMTKERFEQAQAFMETEARPLEKALFHYDFKSGTPEEVWQALSAYRNEDGGFGHAIEPDIRSGVSSALGTSIALGHLLHTGATAEHELVTGAISYLMNTVIYADGLPRWDIIPPGVHDAPRAIWWEYDPNRTDWGNPGAELTAYLLAYREAVTPEFLNALKEQAISYLLNQDASSYEAHELQCAVTLFQHLPEKEQAALFPKLSEMVQACVAKEPEEWIGYSLQPLQIAKTPDNRFYSALESAVQANLDYLLETQSASGCWEPNWNWCRFEEEFEEAKHEWRGVIILNNLRVLRAFQRIA